MHAAFRPYIGVCDIQRAEKLAARCAALASPLPGSHEHRKGGARWPHLLPQDDRRPA